MQPRSFLRTTVLACAAAWLTSLAPAAQADTLTVNINPLKALSNVLEGLHPAPAASAASTASAAPAQPAGNERAEHALFSMAAGVWSVDGGKACAKITPAQSVQASSVHAHEVRAYLAEVAADHLGSEMGNAGPDPQCHLVAFVRKGLQVRFSERCSKGHQTASAAYVLTMNAAGTQGRLVAHDSLAGDSQSVLTQLSSDANAQPAGLPMGPMCGTDWLMNL